MKLGIRPVIRGDRLEGRPSCPGFPLPFGCRHSLLGHPIPAGGLGLPHGRLTGQDHPPGPRRGYRVPHARAATGVGAPYNPRTMVLSPAGSPPRPAPAASQRPVPKPRSSIPSCGVLRAVQNGHARAAFDGDRRVGYERRSKSGGAALRRSTWSAGGIAAPSAGVKRRRAHTRTHGRLSRRLTRSRRAQLDGDEVVPGHDHAERPATAGAAGDRAAARRSATPRAPTARRRRDRTAAPTREPRA